ncbi:SDR family NAD(P)-dependent oxidoreductase [Vreelandella neptunia]|uniref:Glucose 1-dehydrogenase n=1 Tax=Vreelandella neptunia TaxID=115551 RepID=A0ABS9S361_9GAMM|nr:glucose 1-dehydrogenase [Halomonas neptunia]MCH4810560.1 glucose 1-dehydrogenase [Halomonas neptunia]
MTVNLEQFSLEGRVALVTGAGRGIGLAFAKALAKAGAHVVINDLHSDIAEEACHSIEREGGKATPAVFNVTDFDGLDASIEEIVSSLGRLDILINNAGILIRSPIEDHTMPDFMRVIDINLNAVYAVARACARPMKAQGRGRIINTGSVMSISSRPGVISYVAAKHGVLGLTRGLAAELGPHNITVNSIGPGYILTEMNQHVLGTPFEKTVTDRTPMSRWAKPSELGGTAVFLASDAASFVTGQLLMVDGGMTSNSLLVEPQSLGASS